MTDGQSELQRDIEDLEEKAQHAFKCQHVACLMHGKWDQCYNHSHVLCEHFETYYNSKYDRKV